MRCTRLCPLKPGSDTALGLAAVQDIVGGVAFCGIRGEQVAEARLGQGEVYSEAEAGFRQDRVSP
jgi:hypothetical protein